MFVLLLAEELIRGDKPLPLVLELLELALPLGRTITALLEVVRVRTQEEENRAPQRDMQVHRVEHPHVLGNRIQRQLGISLPISATPENVNLEIINWMIEVILIAREQIGVQPSARPILAWQPRLLRPAERLQDALRVEAGRRKMSAGWTTEAGR